MTVFAKASNHTLLPLRLAAGRSAASPVTFAQTLGLFMPAKPGPQAGQVAVLFVSPWGYEEMCVRKFWRVLAEDLADAGVASLRFDYPGTGDALDITTPGLGLDAWRQSIVAAAATLRRLSGVQELVLIGQGLGAALAYEARTEIGDVDGMALLAPVLSGRIYLRKLSVWARMTEGKSEQQQNTDEGFSVGGLTIPDAIVAGIRAINITTPAGPQPGHCLVVARPERPAEAGFADQLTQLFM